MQSFVIVALSFLLSISFIVLLKPICLRLEHVDKPGGHKRHREATPLSGGLAIVLCIVLLGPAFLPTPRVAGFLFGICLLAVLGAWDDRHHIHPWLRLLIQSVAVGIGIVTLAKISLGTLGNLLGQGTIELGIWAVPFTIFAAVGGINAINMIDGIDGLAGTFTLLFLCAISFFTAETPRVSALMLYVCIGGLLGFLMFNLRTPWNQRARVFLGDAGSLVLGYLLVWFAVHSTQGTAPGLKPITIVWLFGLPLADTIYLMASRLLNRKSPMHSDRFHFHHFLLRSGLTPGWTLFFWLLIAATFMAIGITGEHVGANDSTMFIGYLISFGCYCLLMNFAWRGIADGRQHIA